MRCSKVRTPARTLVLASLASLLFVPLQTAGAQTVPLLDYQGFTFETGAFPPSNLGDELSAVAVVDNLSDFFGVDLSTEEVTVWVTDLVSQGQTDVGGGLLTMNFSGGTIEIWRDPAGNRAFGTNPPNGTVPDSFRDGTLMLSGAFSSFFMFYDPVSGTGAFEGSVTFEEGSTLNSILCLTGSGFTFGGVLKGFPALGNVPQGYDLQVDGVLQFETVPQIDVEMIGINDLDQAAGVDQLVRVPDPATGVSVLVGSLEDSFLRSEAIAVLLPCRDAAQTEPGVVDRIFVVDDGELLEVDPLTGVGTPIGAIGYPDVDGIHFHPFTNVLYGVTYGSNDLLTIDTTTGVGTSVVPNLLEGRRLEDIAFHPDGRAFVLTGPTPRVYEIDITNGNKLQRWDLSGGSSLESLLWSLDGQTLYSAADRGNTKDLVRIDLGPGGTGTITFVGPQSSGFRDIEGLAWMHKDQVQSLLTNPDPITGVPHPGAVMTHLGQNTPNPFNPATRIDFVLQRGEPVELAVFDIAGRRIATLLQGHRDAGPHVVAWNGQTQDGRRAASGVYRYVLSGSGWRESRSMILAK